MERNVKLGDGVYVIAHGDHVSCYGFDHTLDEIERIVVELVGRGVLPTSYLERELEAVRAQRGTLAAYDTLINLRDRLKAACEADGDRAAAGLTPQLVGLEGHRVEVEDNGQRRRFIVGKTTGWMPCHLEIKTTRSALGEAARREYASVRDLGPAR